MAQRMQTTQILHDMLEIPGLNASVIVGRDGFVIESAGSLGGMDEDAFGAAVAAMQNGAESMSNELGLSTFHTMTLEARDAMIMCPPGRRGPAGHPGAGFQDFGHDPPAGQKKTARTGAIAVIINE